MRILLFTNTTKALASRALVSICTWLDAQAEAGIVYELFSSGIFEEENQNTRFDEIHERVEEFDLVCSLGGDGTTLRAAHLIGTTGVPLLSYNFGRIGFLAGASEDDLIPAIRSAIEGNVHIDERAMLEVEVNWSGGQSTRQIALNELVISRGHFGRILSLDLAINNTFIDTISGDGVLVSTPTGSTAYALSAGGPIIAPAHEGLCVVPISPHSLNTRAIITAADDVIRLAPNEINRQQLVLFIDGEVFWINAEGVRFASGYEAEEQDKTGGQGDGSSAHFFGSSPSDVRQEKKWTEEPSPCPPAEEPSPCPPAEEPSPCPPVSAPKKDEIASVEVRLCAQKLRLVRYGDYDFYDHISRTFFRGDHD